MSFVFKARRRAHSRAYVTGAVTQKTDDRARKIGELFLDNSQPGVAGTKKKLTAEDAEDAENTEEKTLIQCFETSAFLCVLRG